MTIATQRAALAAAAEALTDLHAQAYVVGLVNVPHFDVALDGIDYDMVFGDPGTADTYRYRCGLYVNRATDIQAQAVLDEYAEPSGSKSVKSALEAAATVTAAGADYIRVPSVEGPLEVTVGAQEFLKLEFTVEVVA